MNAHDRAVAFALAPPPQVRFTPVAYKLIPVGRPWATPERVAKDHDEFAGMEFDPWKRGDLIVTRSTTHGYAVKSPSTWCETWRVCWRATTPANQRPKVAHAKDADGNLALFQEAYALQVWRIPYHWRAAAELLVGLEFESREQLEGCMV